MKPELLLPAGDMEKLKFAFMYGADAVYAGVPVFSLRARENKFKIDSVKEAVDYTRSLGKKIYLTLNIFPHNYKIPVLQKALKSLGELKPDAFIVADPGVIMLCKELAPQVPIHLSVQANNVNWASAKFWHKNGVERVILSREISLAEIKEIHEKNPTLELEFFVHGSICMAYSGRCLLSNYFSYRDANQGTCAHSCRWEYKVYKAHDKNEIAEKICTTHNSAVEEHLSSVAEEQNSASSKTIASNYKKLDGDYYLEELERPGKFFQIDEDEHGTYIMNARDLCLIEYLKELKDAGICSFKVEGRNKTLYYVASVARIYRQAIDDMEAGKPYNPDYLKELAKTSNRGFIPGFLMNNPSEKAQDYEKNVTHQTHEFIGVIRNIHQKGQNRFYEMEVKGRVDTPEKVEIVTPKNIYETTIQNLFSMDGKPVSIIHPGQKDHVLLDLNGVGEDIGVGTILRKLRK